MTNPDREELVKLANELIEVIPRFHDDESVIEAAVAALRRLASSEGGGVKVRELEWRDCPALGGRRKLVAFDCFGNEYRRIDLPARGVDSLKAAAQADYEQRIRSALITAPPADAGMREALAGLRDWIDSFFDRERLKAAERELMERADDALTAPGATTKSDVEALAATTAERPGTVTSEPEPSTSDPSSTCSEVTVSHGIYIASKTKHADRWKRLRNDGVSIISTWIDEAGAGETSDFHDLWHRCLTESANCAVLVSYREPDEVLKGGWVEIGAALAKGVPVYAVGLEEFTIAGYRGITHFPTIEAAIDAAGALLETHQIRRK